MLSCQSKINVFLQSKDALLKGNENQTSIYFEICVLYRSMDLLDLGKQGHRSRPSAENGPVKVWGCSTIFPHLLPLLFSICEHHCLRFSELNHTVYFRFYLLAPSSAPCSSARAFLKQAMQAAAGAG
jgi:hypothetical protein